MELTLLPDEYSIKESTDKSVCLTSHRLIAEDKELGRSFTQDVMLESIVSTELQRISHSSNLILGGVLGVAVLFIGVNTSIEATLLAAGIFVFFVVRFLLSRRSYIVIVCPESKMQINVTRMSHDSVLHFMQAIDEARNMRKLALIERSQAHDLGTAETA